MYIKGCPSLTQGSLTSAFNISWKCSLHIWEEHENHSSHLVVFACYGALCLRVCTFVSVRLCLEIITAQQKPGQRQEIWSWQKQRDCGERGRGRRKQTNKKKRHLLPHLKTMEARQMRDHGVSPTFLSMCDSVRETGGHCIDSLYYEGLFSITHGTAGNFHRIDRKLISS